MDFNSGCNIDARASGQSKYLVLEASFASEPKTEKY